VFYKGNQHFDALGEFACVCFESFEYRLRRSSLCPHQILIHLSSVNISVHRVVNIFLQLLAVYTNTFKIRTSELL